MATRQLFLRASASAAAATLRAASSVSVRFVESWLLVLPALVVVSRNTLKAIIALRLMAFAPERDGNTIRRVTATTTGSGQKGGKVRWGVLGVAKIATTHVIPAMQQGAWAEVVAI